MQKRKLERALALLSAPQRYIVYKLIKQKRKLNCEQSATPPQCPPD